MKKIPGKIIQISSAGCGATSNNDAYILVTALTDQGEVYERYVSHGYSNVPDHGNWLKVRLTLPERKLERK